MRPLSPSVIHFLNCGKATFESDLYIFNFHFLDIKDGGIFNYSIF